MKINKLIPPLKKHLYFLLNLEFDLISSERKHITPDGLGGVLPEKYMMGEMSTSQLDITPDGLGSFIPDEEHMMEEIGTSQIGSVLPSEEHMIEEIGTSQLEVISGQNQNINLNQFGKRIEPTNTN